MEPSSSSCRLLLLIRITVLVTLLLSHHHVVGATGDRRVGNENNDLSIAGYLPDYRFYINVNNTAPLLTDLILFSIQPNADGTLSSCCLAPHHYEAARKAVAYHKEQQQSSQSQQPLNLWLTIGGGGRSQFFFSAVRNAPQKLIRSIRQLAEQENIQGIDFDCEHFANQDDYQVYIKWLRQVAIPDLKRHKYKISIALHKGMFLPTPLYATLDRIHLMTYDMMDKNRAVSKHNSFHADLDKTNEAILQLIESGCEPRKILLGVPAYARHEHNPGLVKTFAEMVDEAFPDIVSTSVQEDASAFAAAVDEIRQLGEWNGYRGDSPMSAAEKVAYAKKMNLGGVFVWELGQDKQVPIAAAAGGFLLQALFEAKADNSAGESVRTSGKTEEL